MGKEIIGNQDAKRGRPSKSGDLIIDGVVILSAEDRKRIRELVTGIRLDGDKIQKLLMSAAEKYYTLGSYINNTVRKLPARPLPTRERVSEVTEVPVHTVTTAFKVFKHFEGHPELLEGLTMREIAVMISDKPEKEGGAKPRIEYGIPSGQLEFTDTDKSFGMPPISGTALVNHRIRSEKGKIYLIKKGFNIPLEIVTVKINPPQEEALEGAYANLNAKMQCAVEEYYSAVEQVAKMEGQT